jgi:hypothetical protein
VQYDLLAVLAVRDVGRKTRGQRARPRASLPTLFLVNDLAVLNERAPENFPGLLPQWILRMLQSGLTVFPGRRALFPGKMSAEIRENQSGVPVFPLFLFTILKCPHSFFDPFFFHEWYIWRKRKIHVDKNEERAITRILASCILIQPFDLGWGVFVKQPPSI